MQHFVEVCDRQLDEFLLYELLLGYQSLDFCILKGGITYGTASRDSPSGRITECKRGWSCNDRVSLAPDHHPRLW